MNANGNWTSGHSAAAVVFIAAIPLPTWWSMTAYRAPLGWFAAGVCILGFCLVAGHGVVGIWRGLIIDDRNVISLSRFQMALWTVIVLSAFIAAAFVNLFMGKEEPLLIHVPGTLWALMGISTTSLVGTPLILAQKKRQAADPAAFAATQTLLAAQGFAPADTTNAGSVIGNARPQLARWSDMFTGDETANGAHLDLAKVQMFFFTLVVAFIYCASLWQMFRYAQSGGLQELPALDESALALIGISHGGYLANKAAPH